MEKYNLSFAIDNDKLFIDADELNTFEKLVSLLEKKEKVEPKSTFDPDLCQEYVFCLKDVVEDIFKKFNLDFKVLDHQTFLEVELDVTELSVASQLERYSSNSFVPIFKVEPLKNGYATVEIPKYILTTKEAQGLTANTVTKNSYIYELQDKPMFILLVTSILFYCY